MKKNYFFEGEMIEFDFDDIVQEYNLTQALDLEDCIEIVEDTLNVYLEDFLIKDRDKVAIDLYNYVLTLNK